MRVEMGVRVMVWLGYDFLLTVGLPEQLHLRIVGHEASCYAIRSESEQRMLFWLALNPIIKK